MGDFWQNLLDGLNIGIAEYGNWHLDIGMLIWIFLIFLAGYIINRLIANRLLDNLRKKGSLEETGRRKIRSILKWIILASVIIGVLKVLQLDLEYSFTFIKKDNPPLIKLSYLIIAFIVFKLAQLFDWLIARILVEKYFDNREQKEKEIPFESPKPKDERSNANKTIQYVVYVVAAILILKGFDLDHKFYAFKDGGGHFSISSILQAILTLLIARLVAWIVTNIILYTYYRRSNVDLGSQFAINKLVSYVIYVVAILHALQNNLHFDLNIILGGAAALMVGIGLGLQQTFNDLISGIILLFERSIEVGDVVEVDGIVGTITAIGIRTSLVEVRDNTSIVVPNSKFITDNVINWSHNDDKVRFSLSVGVAYGSDTEKVREILLQVASEHPAVIGSPKPFVRFTNFGDSSLDFELHFWSRKFVTIEDVKSELRFRVDSEFRKAEVEIPFPQRDIWVRGGQNPTS